MSFLTEREPVRGRMHPIANGVFRLVARNPSKMTYHGTNTYFIADGDGYILLDPGPAMDGEHVHDILQEVDRPIHAILISHGHADHCGALVALKEHVLAPVCSFHAPMDATIVPDVPLRHNEHIGPLTAMHTPGHAPDHLCFARDDGLVFTADHVMAWASSIVSPPNGSMHDYFRSLEFMIKRDDRIYLPGHGPALPEPRAYVEELLKRRLNREQEILLSLQDRAASTGDLARNLYSKMDPVLQAAAERNVMAHLAKLQQEGRVNEDDEVWYVTA